MSGLKITILLLFGLALTGCVSDVQKLGASDTSYVRNLEPRENSTYSLGSITNKFLGIFSDSATTTKLYLDGQSDGCLQINGELVSSTGSACGSGGGGGAGAFSSTTPWTVGSLVQVVDDETLTSIATSTLNIAYSDLVGTPLSFNDSFNATTTWHAFGSLFNLNLNSTTTLDLNSFTSEKSTSSSLYTGELTVGNSTDVLKATAGVVEPVGSPSKNYALLWNGTAPVWAAQGTSFTFDIASFSDNQTATQEIGTGTFLAIGAISFTASYNNGPATSGSVQITSGTTAWSSALDMGSPNYTGPTVSTEAVSYPTNPGTAIRFRLTASDGVDNDTSDVTITLNNKRFWGVTTKTSGFTEADVEGLAGSELSNSGSKTFNSTTGSGEYVLWASRTALGTRTFTVGGFEGGFQSPETVSITNASGYTEDYYVYRSTNSNLGTISVVVN